MLESVEHDQDAPSPQVLDQEVLETRPCLDDPNSLGELRRDEGCIVQLTQRNKEAPVRIRLLDLACGFQGESGLADAAGSRPCQQPHEAAQQACPDAFQLSCPAAKRCRGLRESAGGLAGKAESPTA